MLVSKCHSAIFLFSSKTALLRDFKISSTCIKAYMKSQKKTNNCYTLKILFSLVLILNFSTVGFSQTLKSDRTPAVIVPEQVMKQVVRKVLIWYFKPRNQRKVIYLSARGLQQSWLPEIKGIKFQLLSKQETNSEEYYSFTDVEERLKGKFNISFSYGCQSCGYYGDVWHFRILKQSVTLWKANNESFGSSGNDYGPDHFETPPIMKKKNQ